jgi:hypothetical protein
MIRVWIFWLRIWILMPFQTASQGIIPRSEHLWV